MTTITLPFEEIPLIREPGMVAGLVGGEAAAPLYKFERSLTPPDDRYERRRDDRMTGDA